MKPTRRSALLAVAFASGLLSSPVPAHAEDKTESVDSVIQRIQNSPESTPDFRAFNLLLLANRLLEGATNLAGEFSTASTAQGFRQRNPARWENSLVSWAERFASYGNVKNEGNDSKTHVKLDSKLMPAENRVLADKAIRTALMSADKSSSKFSKLNLYFMASKLFERSGNADGMRTCCKVLAEAFQSCEGNSAVDPEQIKACASVLNSMAYGLIAVQIPEFNPKDSPGTANRTPEISFSEKDFIASEKLKLRTISMVDRLDAKDHVRRKGHRDLALWYMKLRKKQLAEKQRQILFELVGFKDDSVLYPQHEGCGSFVWWKKEKLQGGFDCGRG